MCFSTRVQNILQNYFCTVRLFSLYCAPSSELISRLCWPQSLPQQSWAFLLQQSLDLPAGAWGRRAVSSLKRFKTLVSVKILSILRGAFGQNSLLNAFWTSLMLFNCSYLTMMNDASFPLKGEFSWSGDLGCVFCSFFNYNLPNDTMINIEKCAVLYKCPFILIV